MRDHVRREKVGIVSTKRTMLQVMFDAMDDHAKHGPHSHEDGNVSVDGKPVPKCPHARAGGVCDFWQRHAAEAEELERIIKHLPKAQAEQSRRSFWDAKEREHRERLELLRAKYLDAIRLELPDVQKLDEEFRQPDTPSEVYDQIVNGQGGPDRPLLLGLLVRQCRDSIARDVGRMDAIEALHAFRRVSGPVNGTGPEEIVERQVLLMELLRHRGGWRGKKYDPTKDTRQATAAKELAVAIGEYDRARSPEELTKLQAEVAAGRRRAALLARAYGLKDLSPSELIERENAEGEGDE
jgi:hypothetical protein